MIHLLPYNTLFIQCSLATSCIGAAMGAIGAFAFLRRESLLGDVLAHAALPGIMIALLQYQQITPFVILFGGAASGALGIALVTLVAHATPTKHDTAMGVILSVFFGIGLILITIAQKHTLPSPALVETFLFGNAATLLPADIALIVTVTIFTSIALLLLWRPLYVTSFDQDFARTTQMQKTWSRIFFYFLLVMVTVTGLQTIGVILSSMFLIAPGAAARQWTRHVHTMIPLAAILGSISGFLGASVSSYFHVIPTGPAIVIILSGIVSLSLLYGTQKRVFAS